MRGGDAPGEAYLVDLKLFGKLLDAYAPSPETEARAEEDYLWERIAAAGLEERLDATFIEKEASIKAAYGAGDSYPDRRVYYGVRGLIRGAVRAIGRIIRWIAGVVETIFGAVFDFVKSVIKRIQEGVGLFFEGFRYFSHYLLGRPFVSLGEGVAGTRPVILTRFALDFDVISIADAGATSADIRGHTAYLRRMGEGIEYFLEVATSAIRLIGSLTTPGGWLRLGILIARWVRQWLGSRAETGAVA